MYNKSEQKQLNTKRITVSCNILCFPNNCAFGLGEFNKLGTIVHREISVPLGNKSARSMHRKSGRADRTKSAKVEIGSVSRLPPFQL
jgi:hypothetical protein